MIEGGIGVEHAQRHRRFYRAAYPLARPYLTRKFAYSFETVSRTDEPHIVIANHVTAWDPLLVGLSFPDQIYFVANEFIFRTGPGRLLLYWMGPIVRSKTRTEARAALEILRTVREGHSVCIFAEGATCWDGRTAALTSATAKLIKKSGAGLITYRLEGGYLTLPRWSKRVRRGRMHGGPVRILSAAELQALSVAEIEAILRDDLAEDAFARAEAENSAYPSAQAAENIEAFLFRCPACRGISTLHSHGEELHCDCGLRLRYDAYGHFRRIDGGEPPFATPPLWDEWQLRTIDEDAAGWRSRDAAQPITADEGLELFRIENETTTTRLASGTLTLYNDRLTALRIMQ